MRLKIFFGDQNYMIILKENVSLFNKYIIEDGDRPDTIAEELYGSSRYDFVVILTAL